MVLFLCSLLCRVTQVALFLFPQENNVNITTDEHGVEVVRQSQGDIAFISDTFKIGYYKNKKPCVLMQVGDFGGKIVSWMIQKDSRLKQPIDKAISKLKTSGNLKRMMIKWFMGECAVTTTSSADHAAAAALEAVILGLLLSVAMLC